MPWNPAEQLPQNISYFILSNIAAILGRTLGQTASSMVNSLPFLNSFYTHHMVHSYFSDDVRAFRIQHIRRYTFIYCYES